MKVLAIASSFRRDGNSETLLDRALAGMNKKNAVIKKIALVDLRLHPCTGCRVCLKTGECVIKDDMQLVYKELTAADIILVASPIYFMGLPCQLKCVIDRCQVLWGRKYIFRIPRTENRKPKKAKRYGAAILVSASSGVENMFTGAIRTLKAWFNTLDAEYKYEFIAEGLEGETAALKDKKLLKKAVEFGKKLGEK